MKDFWGQGNRERKTTMRMRRFGELLLAALLCGCGAKVDTGTDGSTHWVQCAVDAECGNGTCNGGHCVSEGATALQGSELQGRACVPVDELSATFGGFNLNEVSVGANASCGTDVCLVNHFQGRTTCKYGQSDAFNDTCKLPGTDLPVSVAVAPQLEDRTAQQAVYCSCRCDGPDPNAEYCTCADGFECNQVIDDLGLESNETGSYCVLAGSNPLPLSIRRTPCDKATDSCHDSKDYAPLAGDPNASGEESAASSTFLLDQIVAPTDCIAASLPLSRDDQGVTGAACKLFEAVPAGADACADSARLSVTGSVTQTLRNYMMSKDLCQGDAKCEDTAFCELKQFERGDAEYVDCLTKSDAGGDGWCYVSPVQGIGTLDTPCLSNGAHSIRYLGAGTPRGDNTFIGCLSSPE